MLRYIIKSSGYPIIPLAATLYPLLSLWSFFYVSISLGISLYRFTASCAISWYSELSHHISSYALTSFVISFNMLVDRLYLVPSQHIFPYVNISWLSRFIFASYHIVYHLLMSTVISLYLCYPVISICYLIISFATSLCLWAPILSLVVILYV